MHSLLGTAFPIGQLFGIRVHIHITFLIFAAYRLFSAGESWQSAAMFSGLIFLSVLLHEFGHCFGARFVGGHASDIMLWPLGGLAFVQAPPRPLEDFITTIAGPLVNVLLCGVCLLILLAGGQGVHFLFDGWTLYAFTPRPEPLFEYTTMFFVINYYLFMFNMTLPMYPMDAGRILHAILWKIRGYQQGTIQTCQFGILLAVLVSAYAIANGMTMLLVIAIMGGLTSWGELQRARAGILRADQFGSYDAVGRELNRRSPMARVGNWFRRLFRRSDDGQRGSRPVNPNPGAWERKQETERRAEEEIDRILKKVSEHGLTSLSYVERQALERATRERREREMEEGRR
ncbi:MAG: M50 family metallopeptidase [Phycisphaerales bacterium]|nr:M50 family metallopeptidase [Phycisphaerales bacterium]